ncbi:hypothetical protein HMP0015_1594 [Acinetobacter haemolyticus ATCC 19194]|uniref:Uncharacterized protein n=1 Tax=Acinetobacter haemolyticus ATCC 19194 TaxID=707232 RepID=D4XPF2_ACIHA|nr:hypothetical protein HMP0015_1594 [Acinetobacter haemolyticus ATCC 19194]
MLVLKPDLFCKDCYLAICFFYKYQLNIKKRGINPLFFIDL